MTDTSTKSSGNQVRTIKSDTWTPLEYGERLFSIGGSIFGPKSEMFKLAISMACIDVLQQDVSKTPLMLRRWTTNGSEVVRPNEHPAARMLVRGPNDFMGMPELLRMATSNLALDSEYYFASLRTRGQELVEFAGIQKNNVSTPVVNTVTRKIFYDVSPSTLYDQAVFGWAQGRRSQKDIAHIKRRSLDGLNVISTAKISAASIKLLSSMQNQQIGMYENGGLAQVAFTFPDGLTDEQFNRLKEGLQKSLDKAQRDGTPVILEGANGIVPGVENLSQTASDQEYVKANIAAAMDVIRYYRVPPHKVFLHESIKYDNMDSAERTYVDDTLCGYFSDITEAFDRVLLTSEERDEYFFAFDIESAYALDPTAKQKIVESRWKNGMITKNQMLRQLGENEIGDGGEIYCFSGNMVLTDKDNEVLMRSGGNAPKDEAEETDEDDDDENDDDAEKGKVVQLVS